MKTYKTLVVDPPWSFRRKPLSIKPPYGLLDLEAIKRIDIRSLAEKDAHLYLWVPNALIREGVEVMECWGFEYKTLFVWVKHQIGIGNYFRNATESALFGVRGRLPVLRRNARNWVLADRREHSRKPDEFYRIVESLSPGPRIDYFSREKRDGWDQWGDQCGFFNSPQGDSNERKQTVKTDGSSGNLGGCAHDTVRVDQRAEDSISKGWPVAEI